jgi:hypothetical protein
MKSAGRPKGLTGAKNTNRSEQPGSSIRYLSQKVKCAIAAYDARSCTPVTLPPMRWLERPVLR